MGVYRIAVAFVPWLVLALPVLPVLICTRGLARALIFVALRFVRKNWLLALLLFSLDDAFFMVLFFSSPCPFLAAGVVNNKAPAGLFLASCRLVQCMATP
jgi:hypothetical protein